MTMETKNIAVSLAKCQAEFPKIELDATVTVKTKTGASYSFEYATLANILNHCLPVLSKNGLSLTQAFKGKLLVTSLLDKSGERLISAIPLDLHNASMQELGSRISYLKRYSISAMLGIVGEEDDDGNIADGNKIKKETTKPARKSTPQATQQAKPISDEPLTDPQRKKLWAMMMNKTGDKDVAKQFVDYMQPETKVKASGFIEKFEEIFKLWNGSIYDVECKNGEMVKLNTCIECKDIKACKQLA